MCSPHIQSHIHTVRAGSDLPASRHASNQHMFGTQTGRLCMKKTQSRLFHPHCTREALAAPTGRCHVHCNPSHKEAGRHTPLVPWQARSNNKTPDEPQHARRRAGGYTHVLVAQVELNRYAVNGADIVDTPLVHILSVYHHIIGLHTISSNSGAKWTQAGHQIKCGGAHRKPLPDQNERLGLACDTGRGVIGGPVQIPHLHPQVPGRRALLTPHCKLRCLPARTRSQRPEVLLSLVHTEAGHLLLGLSSSRRPLTQAQLVQLRLDRPVRAETGAPARMSQMKGQPAALWRDSYRERVPHRRC
eukprot:scaffold3036_cov414-Prasinococcus_capsulatus_cf.AAC.28